MDPRLLVISTRLHASHLRLEGWRWVGEPETRRINIKSQEDWTKAYLAMIEHDLSRHVQGVLRCLESDQRGSSSNEDDQDQEVSHGGHLT